MRLTRAKAVYSRAKAVCFWVVVEEEDTGLGVVNVVLGYGVLLREEVLVGLAPPALLECVVVDR